MQPEEVGPGRKRNRDITTHCTKTTQVPQQIDAQGCHCAPYRSRGSRLQELRVIPTFQMRACECRWKVCVCVWVSVRTKMCVCVRAQTHAGSSGNEFGAKRIRGQFSAHSVSKLFRLARRRKHTRPLAFELNLERYSSLEMLPSTTAGILASSHSLRLMTPSLHIPIQIHSCCALSYRIKGRCALPERAWWQQNGRRWNFRLRNLSSLYRSLPPSLLPKSLSVYSTHLLRSSSLNRILISFSEKPRFLSPDTTSK